MLKWLFESDKYTDSPYKFICKLDTAIKELSSAVFQQKGEKERLTCIAKVIKYVSKLIASDANAHQTLLSRAISDEKRDGLINASARNTAVAMTAMACAAGTLEYSKEFCDLIEKYNKASSVARGKNNFKEMEDYGHMFIFSIHPDMISTRKISVSEESDSVDISLPKQI